MKRKPLIVKYDDNKYPTPCKFCKSKKTSQLRGGIGDEITGFACLRCGRVTYSR